MFTLFLLILWIVLAVLVGMHAERRYDRSHLGWFFLALLVSPLMAWFMLILVGKKPTPIATPHLRERVVDWSKVDWSGNKSAQLATVQTAVMANDERQQLNTTDRVMIGIGVGIPVLLGLVVLWASM